MLILTIGLGLMSYFISPQIRLLNFKIRSIDKALVSSQFNISQKIALLKLQDELVVERFHIVLEEKMKYNKYQND